MGAIRVQGWDINEQTRESGTVIIRRTLTKAEFDAMIAWVVKDPGSTGTVWGSASHWDRERCAMFLFSDANTAIGFKVRWA